MEKSLLILLAGLMLFFAANVFAIPNPAASYCENMGYSLSGENCVFGDGTSCEQWAFYRGECGQNYVKNLPCRQNGQTVGAGQQCCEGLKGLPVSTPDVVTGQCMSAVGGWPVCRPCGNGTCDQGENSCNCSADCATGNLSGSCDVSSLSNCNKSCQTDNDCKGEACGCYNKNQTITNNYNLQLSCAETGGCMCQNNVCTATASAYPPAESLPACGDGVCQTVACTANGCPPAESNTNCPQDCKIGSAPNSGTISTSVCPAGCVCAGNMVSCPTPSKPIQVQIKQSGLPQPASQQPVIISPVNVSIGKTPEGKTTIKSGSTQAVSSQNIKVVDKKLYMETSSSQTEEVKIMPETASAAATEKLGSVKNVRIELKETGQKSGKLPAYELIAEKPIKVFGIMPATANITTQVNAQTGEVISVKKPWWMFFAW